MSVTPVTTLEQFKQIISQDTFTVFDFWATWCGPCKVISPIFERFAAQFSGVEFFKVDVDAAQDISEEVGIRAMPTFILFKNGEKVSEVVGANPQGLQALLQKAA